MQERYFFSFLAMQKGNCSAEKEDKTRNHSLNRQGSNPVNHLQTLNTNLSTTTNSPYNLLRTETPTRS
ncbi:hypothetical protein EUGRSUZ_H00036 [Eucalyptus grandis]|uniref:Uncharacterized protein n=2 Tax=Eucalyptus grandis TaxID=71139 RepID=A0ACC3JKV9_EUCGR|nr:hypothetical protein EUGRSUZ_H00036 [Eucalyptus grandis]